LRLNNLRKLSGEVRSLLRKSLIMEREEAKDQFLNKEKEGKL